MIGDAVVTIGRGGMVITNDGTITTLLGVAGDYLRIGDGGETGHSLNSEDDLMVTGDLEVDGTTYLDGASTLTGIVTLAGYTTATNVLKVTDDVDFRLGADNDIRVLYETADADAKVMLFVLDESVDAGNNVPAFVFGEMALRNADLGLFDAVVEPLVAVVDLDADSYIGLSFSADDVPILTTNRTAANGIVLTNLKYASASTLSGTQLDVEIDMAGTPYHFTVYPTKA